MLLWKFKALCNKGVWGVPICYGALHIGVWGLKTAILGVKKLFDDPQGSHFPEWTKSLRLKMQNLH